MPNSKAYIAVCTNGVLVPGKKVVVLNGCTRLAESGNVLSDNWTGRMSLMLGRNSDLKAKVNGATLSSFYCTRI